MKFGSPRIAAVVALSLAIALAFGFAGTKSKPGSLQSQSKVSFKLEDWEGTPLYLLLSTQNGLKELSDKRFYNDFVYPDFEVVSPVVDKLSDRTRSFYGSKLAGGFSKARAILQSLAKEVVSPKDLPKLIRSRLNDSDLVPNSSLGSVSFTTSTLALFAAGACEQVQVLSDTFLWHCAYRHYKGSNLDKKFAITNSGRTFIIYPDGRAVDATLGEYLVGLTHSLSSESEARTFYRYFFNLIFRTSVADVKRLPLMQREALFDFLAIYLAEGHRNLMVSGDPEKNAGHRYLVEATLLGGFIVPSTVLFKGGQWAEGTLQDLIFSEENGTGFSGGARLPRWKMQEAIADTFATIEPKLVQNVMGSLGATGTNFYAALAHASVVATGRKYTLSEIDLYADLFATLYLKSDQVRKLILSNPEQARVPVP